MFLQAELPTRWTPTFTLPPNAAGTGVSSLTVGVGLVRNAGRLAVRLDVRRANAKSDRATDAGVWKRSLGFFAIIRFTITLKSVGPSSRNSSIALGSPCWCYMNWRMSVPSGNGGWPVSS